MSSHLDHFDWFFETLQLRFEYQQESNMYMIFHVFLMFFLTFVHPPNAMASNL